MTTNLKSLIGKLTPATRRALESAANIALSRTHHEVDIEHVLLELLAATDGDMLRILKAYRIDAQRLRPRHDVAQEGEGMVGWIALAGGAGQQQRAAGAAEQGRIHRIQRQHLYRHAAVARRAGMRVERDGSQLTVVVTA